MSDLVRAARLARPGSRLPAGERGQALLGSLAALAALFVGVAFLFGWGGALAAKGRHQRAADLAAVSAAHAMRAAWPRLFEPPRLGSGVANPRHLTAGGYAALVRAAATRAAVRNGVAAGAVRVRLLGGDAGGGASAAAAAAGPGGIAPTRVEVRVAGDARLPLAHEDGRVPVRARAVAELAPPGGGGAAATGGGYSGPLAHRDGKPMRPDVALAYDRLAAAARREAGLRLVVVSGYRSDAEQARLWAANPNPRWVARPGTSLHRYGTELDLGPPAAYPWLARNARRFGFVQRYAWEPWHFGYTRSPGSASVGYGTRGVPSFVPARFREAIARAARRWSVGAALLAAQLHVESGFDPRARSPAGALGIAQFMPATARAYGLRDPFDPDAAIDAQAHLMRDLLRRFGSVPLALAAYNAGPGAVARYGGIPPFDETRAYVARIVALAGGDAALGVAGDDGIEVRLVE